MMLDTRTRTVEQYEQGRMAKLVAMAAVVAGFARRRGEPRVPKRPAVRLPKRKKLKPIRPRVVDSEGRAYMTLRAAAASWMVAEQTLCIAVSHGTSCRGRFFRRYNPARDSGAVLVPPGRMLVESKSQHAKRYATEEERIVAKRAAHRERVRRYRQNADSDALQPRTDVSTPEPTPTPSEGEETRQRASKCERQSE